MSLSTFFSSSRYHRIHWIFDFRQIENFPRASLTNLSVSECSNESSKQEKAPKSVSHFFESLNFASLRVRFTGEETQAKSIAKATRNNGKVNNWEKKDIAKTFFFSFERSKFTSNRWIMGIDNLFLSFMFIEQNILYSATCYDNLAINQTIFMISLLKNRGDWGGSLHQIGQKLARFSTPFTVKRREKTFLMLQHLIQLQFLILTPQSSITNNDDWKSI